MKKVLSSLKILLIPKSATRLSSNVRSLNTNLLFSILILADSNAILIFCSSSDKLESKTRCSGFNN